MKHSRKTMSKKAAAILAIVTAIVVLAVVVLNFVLLFVLDGLATSYLGSVSIPGKNSSKESEESYYTSAYESASDLSDAEMELGSQIGEEGAVLLKNEDCVLPLEKGTTVSLFGTSCVSLNYGGSGSGSGSTDLNVDLKTACEEAGLTVNETLWNFYLTGNGSKDDEGNAYGIGPGSIQYGADFDWSINECPVERIENESGLTDTFAGTTAIYVLTRTGGEDGDLTRDMAAYGGESGQHYLELDSTEQDLVSYLDRTFEDVIIIVNTSNTMELGWVEDFEHVKGVISVAGLGRSGAQGLANFLVGYDGDEEISPSGHLVDTIAYDVFSSPAMQNMGDYRYTGTDYTYVSYSEGIYVGYRYYETRYEDTVLGTENVGDYNYDEIVQYPFGYGLSYTEFSWSDFTLSEPDENGDMTISLTVTNTGDRKGKDVVEIYLSKPYTDYDQENGIEKASVELAGYAKTKNLDVGESETVQVTVNKEQFKSYDATNAKTYILDAGAYYLTAATNAHDAVNNVLAAKGYETDGDASFAGSIEQAELDSTTYAVDDKTGTAITNQFDEAALSDGTYLSRSNWSLMDGDGLRYGEASDIDSPMEMGGKAFEHEISDDLLEQLSSTDSLSPAQDAGESAELPETEQENGVELLDLRGKSYDDPLWDELISELSLDDLRKIVYVNGYSCLGELPAINKPSSVENDGPAGINDFQNHDSIDIGDGEVTMNWPAEALIAATWNDELAAGVGTLTAEDGLWSGTTGWYGPAMNLHRTPFGGRNFEYYSEDPYLGGRMTSAEVKTASEGGLITYIKHFVLNDQETHRAGVATWANEQPIRELYLKPFEMVLHGNTVTETYLDAETGEMTETERDACHALMTSYNRIGATWAGGNYRLLTNVLREEWGFQGLVLTDYNQSQEFMDTEHMLYAGGNSKLRTLDQGFTVTQMKKNPALAQLAYDSAHHYLYAQANSNIVNRIVPGQGISGSIPVYRILLLILDLVAAVAVIRNILKCRRAFKAAS